MQRTQPQPPPIKSKPLDPAFDLDLAVFTRPRPEGCSAIFAPLHYEPNYAYPLLVWLHGPGDDENQLKRIMPLVSMRNYVAVAPRGSAPCEGSPAGRPGYRWRQDEEHIEEAEQRVFDSMEAVEEKFHVAPHRVFLAGFDCGGTMAYRIALDHPERFAGVLSLGGAFPTSRTPLAQLHAARRVALFLACGRDSQTCPSEQVCDNLRLFHAAGMSITLRQYPCAQEITTQMLGDMDRWIMEQICSPKGSDLSA
ncbi:MAG: alpha/beta hydrolase [Pirellulales bacterium]